MTVVTRVRHVQAPDGTHDHLGGVCTAEGVYYSRYDVADAIDAGETWWSEGDGTRVLIRKAPFCPVPGCLTFPYLTTAEDDQSPSSLEQLPAC